MKEYTFLVEIGTESLPSGMLKRLGKDFFCHIVNGLKANNISYNKADCFVSSCRLAVKAKIIIQGNFNINISGDNEIYNHDSIYTRYIKDLWIKVHLIASSNLDFVSSMQNIYLQGVLGYGKSIVIHQNIRNALCTVISFAFKKLHHYSMMRWGDVDMSFIRPIRTITVLLDTHLIPGYFFDVKVSRVLYGNRFLEKYKLTLTDANYYPDILFNNGWVIADYNKRKNIICSAIKKEAKKLGGIIDIQDNNLLEEVTAQVEWPVILSGKFDKNFLKLPREVILHIMRYDQKYFPVYSAIDREELLPYFIFVAHTVSDNYKRIINGHEQVIMPRLMDADFFLRNDSKYRLEDYISKLNSVSFHRSLGTLRDKIFRIAALSGWIAERIGEDIEQTKRAGYLCKCDLMSSMVFEFPSTQGIIGMYYARRDGEAEEIALAQKEHYQPLFSKDRLPATSISCVVSVADKMDTISGIFGIKEFPKGNRDPFALKRFAIGILRIFIYKKWALSLLDLIQKSVNLYGAQLSNTTVITDINNFIYNRLYSWYCARGYRADIVRAVLRVRPASIVDIDARIEAVATFCRLKKKENINFNLIYKRISNILSKKQIDYNREVQDSLFKFPEEIYLAMQIGVIENQVQFLCAQYRYYDALVMTMKIFGAVNVFFDNVIVMDQNQDIQINRLALLLKVKRLFLKVVDISLLHI